MRIEERKVTVGEVCDGYFNDAEEGVVGYGERLDIRPRYQREFVYKDKQRDEATKRQSAMLLGLGHDRIVYLGSCYVERGYITQDEYENLHDYLYGPYLALGGNGTAKKVMAEVERLPLHKNKEE